MTAPRRTLLRGLGAVALAPDLAGAGLPVASPDAELIRVCARYLELERIMSDPRHPDIDKDTEDMPEYAEYSAASSAIEDAEPQTLEGWAALARVALLATAAIDDGHWDDGEELRIAHKILRHLAGPATVQEERVRTADWARRRKENLARLNAEAAPRPVSRAELLERLPEGAEEAFRGIVRVLDRIEAGKAGAA